jgi:dihydrodipicolinate synthase/N-acetylneuraminate lyase
MDALDKTAAWPIDGYLIASPYYTRPSQRGLLQHFSALADHASWPIVLYNIPYRTGVSLTNETLLQLALHPNIVGMKDCGADRAQSIDLLSRRPSGFRVLTGEDALYHEALADGADGAILLSRIWRPKRSPRCRRSRSRVTATARWRAGRYSPGPAAVRRASPAPAIIGARRADDSAEVRLPMVEVSPARGVAGRGNRAAQATVVAPGLEHDRTRRAALAQVATGFPGRHARSEIERDDVSKKVIPFWRSAPSSDVRGRNRLADQQR